MKKVMVILLVLILQGKSAFCNLPVIDVSSIAAAIQNGLTMYESLQATYTNLSQLQSQLKMMEENAKTFNIKDLKDIDFSSWAKSLGASDKLTNNLDNLESVIKNKSLTINGVNFSIEDLYTTNVYKKLGKVGEKWAIQKLSNLSEEEKREFHNKYGMTVEEFEKMAAVAEEMNKTLTESKARIEVLDDYIETVRDEVESFVKIFDGETSEKALLQSIGKVLARIDEGIINLTSLVSDTNKALLNHISTNKTEEENSGLSVEEEYDEIQKQLLKAYEGDESDYLSPENFMTNE